MQKQYMAGVVPRGAHLQRTQINPSRQVKSGLTLNPNPLRKLSETTAHRLNWESKLKDLSCVLTACVLVCL